MIIFKILILLGCSLVGYLAGSIPSGVLIGKYIYHIDPRETGSHNTGGTNVGRTMGHKAGILTIVLDMFKIILPFLGAWALFTFCTPLVEFMSDGDYSLNAFGQGNTLCELAYYLVALAGLFGHSYSIYIKFKGGKLVACYSGFALATSWTALPIFAPIFFVTLKIKKYVSLSSLTMCGAFAVFSWVLYILFIFLGPKIPGWFMFSQYGPHICIYYPVVVTLSYALMIWKHRANLGRIKNGTESKITWMK